LVLWSGIAAFALLTIRYALNIHVSSWWPCLLQSTLSRQHSNSVMTIVGTCSISFIIFRGGCGALCWTGGKKTAVYGSDTKLRLIAGVGLIGAAGILYAPEWPLKSKWRSTARTLPVLAVLDGPMCSFVVNFSLFLSPVNSFMSAGFFIILYAGE